MLNVSQAYQTMMTKRKVSSRLEMTITSGMEVESLTDKDILADQFSITWRASNNGDFTFGTCYASSLNFTTVNCGFGHGGEVGEDISVVASVFYDIGNGQEEEIKLGTFFVDKINQSRKTVSFSCLDAMVKFDKPIQSIVNGYPQHLFIYICETCGVELGTTSAEFSSMPNAGQMAILQPDEMPTYRDALSYLSSIVGGYCIIGRDGKLYVRQFHSSPDITLGTYRSTQATRSGLCRFNGVKCRFLAEENFYPYSYIDDERIGTVVDLGDIPIISDTDTAKNNILKNIYDNVLLNYEYRMCNIRIVGNPAIEAGDCISYTDSDGISEISILTCVTFNLHGESILISEGQDTLSGGVSSKGKKSNQQAQKMTEELSIVTVTYVNASPIEVDGTDETEISLLRYVTNKDVTVIFGAEIPVISDGEGVVTLTYSDSGLTGDVVHARVHEGYNLITLVNHIYNEANSIVNLSLLAETSGINGGSAPTLTIEENTIRSYVFAQGISGEAAWDGIIVLSDYVHFSTSTLGALELSDSVSVSLTEPLKLALTELVSPFYFTMKRHRIEDGEITITMEYVDVSFCDTEIYCGEARLL